MIFKFWRAEGWLATLSTLPYQCLPIPAYLQSSLKGRDTADHTYETLSLYETTTDHSYEPELGSNTRVIINSAVIHEQNIDQHSDSDPYRHNGTGNTYVSIHANIVLKAPTYIYMSVSMKTGAHNEKKTMVAPTLVIMTTLHEDAGGTTPNKQY